MGADEVHAFAIARSKCGGGTGQRTGAGSAKFRPGNRAGHLRQPCSQSERVWKSDFPAQAIPIAFCRVSTLTKLDHFGRLESGPHFRAGRRIFILMRSKVVISRAIVMLSLLAIPPLAWTSPQNVEVQAQIQVIHPGAEKAKAHGP